MQSFDQKICGQCTFHAFMARFYCTFSLVWVGGFFPLHVAFGVCMKNKITYHHEKCAQST